MESIPALFVVATPIGNLGDMVPRAVEVLQSADVIAAEDTRHSRPLLQHFGITTTLISYHDHSGDATVDAIVARLHSGQRVALISDAGTPLISDPGYRIVDRALAEGFRVVPVPGASAAIAALSVAGLPSDRFAFEGFLPAKATARALRLAELAGEPRTLIFYEAPHRVLETLREMRHQFGDERVVVLARELTKLYETVRRLPLREMCEWVASDTNQQRGECVLLVAGAERRQQALSPEATRVLDILLEELPLRQAAALAARITGEKKNRLYQYALERSSGDDSP